MTHHDLPSNRRCEPRILARHLVACTPHPRPGSGTPVYTARTLDLSESGTRLESNHAFAPGEELDLDMALSGEILHLRALAVHSECLPDGSFAAGLRFTRVPASERARLHATLENSGLGKPSVRRGGRGRGK